MSSATNANPTILASNILPGYDVSGHQYSVAVRLVNVQTDNSVTPGVVYGDLVANLPSGIGLTSEYPVGATPVGSSSGNQSNATATATLPGVSGKTTYIKGFHVTGSGATIGLGVILTVTGLLAGTFSYVYTATAGAILANTPLLVLFGDGLPASSTNTPIVVSCPALGLGNLNNVVNAWGYQL
jgi:hypothetical protein